MGEKGPSEMSHEAPDWISAWTLRACNEGAARSFDSTTLIAKPFLNLTRVLFQSMTFNHFGDASKKHKLLSSNGKLPCMTPLLNKTCTLIACGPEAIRSTDYLVCFQFLFIPLLKTASSLWHKPLLLSLCFSPLPSDLTYIQLLQ